MRVGPASLLVALLVLAPSPLTGQSRLHHGAPPLRVSIGVFDVDTRAVGVEAESRFHPRGSLATSITAPRHEDAAVAAVSLRARLHEVGSGQAGTFFGLGVDLLTGRSTETVYESCDLWGTCETRNALLLIPAVAGEFGFRVALGERNSINTIGTIAAQPERRIGDRRTPGFRGRVAVAIGREWGRSRGEKR
jgi:hypothetical protein